MALISLLGEFGPGWSMSQSIEKRRVSDAVIVENSFPLAERI